MNDELENQEIENKESMEMVVQDFSKLSKKSKVKQNIYTTIQDQKVIFNLENSCDYKINDCKGEGIRINDVLIKIIEKPLENPEINEETGEIEKDKEIKMITIIIDDNGKSYVTGSKSFALQLTKYIEMFGIESVKGLEIEITERAIKGSGNKVLAFKLM